ncbi:MAG: DUF2971 domain-containing protein [Janthinobacterium lividum]
MDTNFKTSIQAEYNDLINGKNELFKYIDYESSLKILSNTTLAFKCPVDMNDPYDCSLDFLDLTNPPEDYLKDLLKEKYAHLSRQERRKRIAYSIKNFKPLLPDIFQKGMKSDLKKRGITCFSEINDNLLMWSHYGKSHTGICIGFDVVKLYESIKVKHQFDKLFIKVRYETEFQMMNFFDDTEKAVINWVRTKSFDWNYEKEVRITLSNLKFNSDGLYILPIDKNCIKHVYLGSRILPEHESYVRELIAKQYPDVIIKKLKLNTNKFELIDE